MRKNGQSGRVTDRIHVKKRHLNKNLKNEGRWVSFGKETGHLAEGAACAGLQHILEKVCYGRAGEIPGERGRIKCGTQKKAAGIVQHGRPRQRGKKERSEHMKQGFPWEGQKQTTKKGPFPGFCLESWEERISHDVRALPASSRLCTGLSWNVLPGCILWERGPSFAVLFCRLWRPREIGSDWQSGLEGQALKPCLSLFSSAFLCCPSATIDKPWPRSPGMRILQRAFLTKRAWNP